MSTEKYDVRKTTTITARRLDGKENKAGLKSVNYKVRLQFH